MADNQQVKSSRDLLFEKAAARFPERKFQGQPGQDGQNGQDGTDVLEDSILQMLDEDSARLEVLNEKNSKLYNLLFTDPDATEVIQRWAETGDPRAALIEVFGDDFIEAAKSEEGMSKFKESLAGWRERNKREQEIREKVDENWEKSKADCVAWGEKKGLTVEQMSEVMLRLLAVSFNGMENIYNTEDFEMVWRDMNYDNDVQTARKEGEVTGRNAKIAATRHERSLSGSMPPNSPGGAGVTVNTNKKEQSVWSQIE